MLSLFVYVCVCVCFCVRVYACVRVYWCACDIPQAALYAGKSIFPRICVKSKFHSDRAASKNQLSIMSNYTLSTFLLGTLITWVSMFILGYLVFLIYLNNNSEGSVLTKKRKWCETFCQKKCTLLPMFHELYSMDYTTRGSFVTPLRKPLSCNGNKQLEF